MFVVSVEGPAYIDRENWSTHKVLGVFNTREEAIIEYSITPDEPTEPADPAAIDDKDEFERDDTDTILILTDLSTGQAERLN